MYGTKPRRFFVEFDSSEIHAKLKAKAIKRGTYTEDCDDWFDPADVLDSEDADTLEEARRIAKQHAATALYGEARIYERKGIVEVGPFWDYDESKEVETVNA